MCWTPSARRSGGLGGALAGVRPDDLAATDGEGRGRAAARSSIPAAIEEVVPRRRQPGRRGQPQRGPHGRAAGRAAGHHPRRHREPAVRLGPGGGDRRQPRRRRRRRRRRAGRGRGVDEPGAVGAAQAGQGLPDRPRAAVEHHPRLADDQPADAERVDGLAGRGRGAPGRQVRASAGRSRTSSRSAPTARPRPRGTRAGSPPRWWPVDGAAARPGREHPRRHDAREAGDAASRCSAPPARSPRATPRR